MSVELDAEKDDAAAAAPWFSIKSLFSDDRDQGFEVDDDADVFQDAASEIETLKLDIRDIQDAVKNHDLWINDLANIKRDIIELQEAQRCAALQSQQSERREQESYKQIATSKKDCSDALAGFSMQGTMCSKDVNQLALVDQMELKCVVASLEQTYLRQAESIRYEWQAALEDLRDEVRETSQRLQKFNSTSANSQEGSPGCTHLFPASNFSRHGPDRSSFEFPSAFEYINDSRISEMQITVRKLAAEITSMRAPAQRPSPVQQQQMLIDAVSVQQMLTDDSDSQQGSRQRSRSDPWLASEAMSCQIAVAPSVNVA